MLEAGLVFEPSSATCEMCVPSGVLLAPLCLVVRVCGMRFLTDPALQPVAADEGMSTKNLDLCPAEGVSSWCVGVLAKIPGEMNLKDKFI